MEALSLVGCECRDGSDLAREQSLHQQSSSSSNILSLAFKVAKTIQCISLSIMPIGDVNSLLSLMSVRWLVGLSKVKDRKLQFHAPIGALVP